MATVMCRNGPVMLRATRIDTASANNRINPAAISDRWVEAQVCAFRSSM